MAVLGAWALAVGIGDLLTPMDTGRDAGWRVMLAALAVPIVAILACLGVGLSRVGSLTMGAVTFVSGGLWLWLRHRGAVRSALTMLAGGFVGLIFAAGYWTQEHAPIAALLDRSPFIAMEPDAVLFALGLGLLLVATANRIVRMVLGKIERELLAQENQLKGGRFIGPLERLLIYGLGLSGQWVAAGIVVAAKSLLRFGEVRSHESTRAELMSEYLLVGSLLSWSLAFLAVGVAAVGVVG